MKATLIVVDHLDNWKPFAQGPMVISATNYLCGETAEHQEGRIINLCADNGYLSVGYYVSLLAEARGKRVLPGVKTLLTLGGEQKMTIPCPSALRDTESLQDITIHFGRCIHNRFSQLASRIFTLHPVPILHAKVRRDRIHWIVENLRVGRLEDLNEEEESFFAESLDQFSRRIWRQPVRRRHSHYDLAILLDPEEDLPPSNQKAIRLFEKTSKTLGFETELIAPEEEHRLLEFDALFIRCTTSIDHFSYRMAQRAVKEGLAVIDHPDAILRCCNKVFLNDLMQANKVAMPASELVMRHPGPNPDRLIKILGLPLVLKVPDGSFSRGVFKVENKEDLIEKCLLLLKESAVIIAQAYVPTPFDWRIGVIDGRPLYACRYHMARDHWQVVNHAATSKGSNYRFGNHECLPLAQVPNRIIRTAAKAARLIGNGLFGVDLKEIDGDPLVIEVNDNPSIDAGVEDLILGEELYRQIMAHLIGQLHVRGKPAMV